MKDLLLSESYKSAIFTIETGRWLLFHTVMWGFMVIISLLPLLFKFGYLKITGQWDSFKIFIATEEPFFVMFGIAAITIANLIISIKENSKVVKTDTTIDCILMVLNIILLIGALFFFFTLTKCQTKDIDLIYGMSYWGLICTYCLNGCANFIHQTQNKKIIHELTNAKNG